MSPQQLLQTCSHSYPRLIPNLPTYPQGLSPKLSTANFLVIAGFLSFLHTYPQLSTGYPHFCPHPMWITLFIHRQKVMSSDLFICHSFVIFIPVPDAKRSPAAPQRWQPCTSTAAGKIACDDSSFTSNRVHKGTRRQKTGTTISLGFTKDTRHPQGDSIIIPDCSKIVKKSTPFEQQTPSPRQRKGRFASRGSPAHLWYRSPDRIFIAR